MNRTLIASLLVLAAAAPASADLVFGSGSSAVGVTTGTATPVAGGTPIELFVSDGGTFAATTGSGHTGGGILGVDGMSLSGDFDALITNGLLPGDSQLVYHAIGEAVFDTANYTGNIDNFFPVKMAIQTPQDMAFSISQSGSFGTGSVVLRRLDGGDMTSEIAQGLLFGTIEYEVFHDFRLSAGNDFGYSPSEQYEGTWTLSLALTGGTAVPLPVSAGLALPALAGLAAVRRRPRV